MGYKRRWEGRGRRGEEWARERERRVDPMKENFYLRYVRDTDDVTPSTGTL